MLTPQLPPKTARPVRANAGLALAYKRELQALIAAMQADMLERVTVTYREHPPHMAQLVDLAQDAEPSDDMRRTFARLAQDWIERFNTAAPRIAEAYLRGQFKASDSALMQSLKAAGWTVNFQATAAVRDAFQASLAENVGLIRSIPAQYLEQVEGSVMRSYVAGRDLEALTTELKAIYPKAANRATLIARDQSNKANAVVNRARSLELGITEAIWVHSGGGKHPRPSHLKAGQERKRYKIAEGCYIDGEFIQPGELINCRCTSRPILPV